MELRLDYKAAEHHKSAAAVAEHIVEGAAGHTAAEVGADKQAAAHIAEVAAVDKRVVEHSREVAEAAHNKEVAVLAERIRMVRVQVVVQGLLALA
jgi:hypothetical protein